MKETNNTLGVVGAGAMGSGIAQVAATAGWTVTMYDQDPEAVKSGINKISKIFDRLVSKGRLALEEKEIILSRIHPVDDPISFSSVDLVIEAIVEKLDIKKSVFKELENITGDNCILASNTSSLSITSIASAVKKPEKIIGIHFFNPPGLMKLVEVIPGYLTSSEVVHTCKKIISEWGKVVVVAKDSPGFIVNKIARPFYSEAIRIVEEGIAQPGEVDWVMTTQGGFRMGPFTLMDYIGHDVNYAVTESVWKAFYHEPRYQPSLTQKRLVEAGLLGRKAGRGFYDYRDGGQPQLTEVDAEKSEMILNRILAMLINEAADAVYYDICTEEDADLAMTRGVNYPLGLIEWGEKIGWRKVAKILHDLYSKYKEERYRTSLYILNKI
jgi:3-hydroxybutyryl-CoA dehydrogenase